MNGSVPTPSTSDSDNLFAAPIGELSPSMPISVEETTTIADTISLMRARRIGCVLITNNKKLVGIFTERDVLLDLAGLDFDLKQPVSSVMTPNPESLTPGDPIAYALNRMSLGGYRHVPLTDDNDVPVGIISVKDIVEFIVAESPGEVYNLPPQPGVYGSSREGG